MLFTSSHKLTPSLISSIKHTAKYYTLILVQRKQATNSMCQKNFPFPVRSMEWPVIFHFRSWFVCYLFMICSYSFQSPFEVRAHFPSVSNPFYICSMFAIQLLHVAVYEFYTSLKSVHAGKQFACSRKKNSDSVTAVIRSLSAHVHASLNHTLC